MRWISIRHRRCTIGRTRSCLHHHVDSSHNFHPDFGSRRQYCRGRTAPLQPARLQCSQRRDERLRAYGTDLTGGYKYCSVLSDGLSGTRTDRQCVHSAASDVYDDCSCIGAHAVGDSVATTPSRAMAAKFIVHSTEFLSKKSRTPNLATSRDTCACVYAVAAKL